ncbi:autotransporter-associated beta strand repeat-containing protein [Luteolibacter arcticus]|uniref:Autotransporter-associated beta strand repeat-containing protein n=1 Tax=Luteolibacter arcticus TaxID=1581411 RepID=A0ABT3GH50_9BACT|nr:autotransporter-associated beta strand repeat-containing protein [Luteolibacter arcticus]MCW1922640.1 autotransporter-associated beta strand repeat-containing protein [Luteolibacter arcticus]
MKIHRLYHAVAGVLILVSPEAAAATLEAYLPLDGTLDAGTGTSIQGTAIGTNGTPGDNFTTGKFGQAASFTNTNTTATTPNDWAVTLGNLDTIYASSFTISIWVQTTTVGFTADKGFFGNKNWTSGANVGWTLSTASTTGGGGRVNWNTSGGTRKDPNIAFNNGNWNQIVVVFDRETNEVERFLNGASIGKTTAAFSSAGAGSLAAAFPTLIGGSGNGTYSAGSVRLDDAAIFSGKLSASQIIYLYNGGTGRTADQFDAAPVSKNLTWSGLAGSEWSTNAIPGAKNWVLTSDGVTAANFANSDAVLFDDVATGTTVDISNGNVSPIALSFQNTAKNFTVTGSNGIVGNLVLLKSGMGALTLANPNFHVGKTLLNEGSLMIGHELALQNSTLEAVFGASTHAFGPITAATLGGLAGNADLVLEGSNAQALSLTVGGNNANTVFGGQLSGDGSLTKAGTGRLSLTFDNTFTGGITVANGSLRAQAGTAFPAGTITSTGGVIEFGIASSSETVISNPFVLPVTGTGNLRMFSVFGSGGLAPTPGTAIRLTGKISGGVATRSFQFSDTGVGGEHDNILIFDNATNDFTGTVNLNRGTIAFTSDAALGDPENDILHFSENLLGKIRFDADNIVLNAQRAVNLPSTENNRPFDTQGFTSTIAGPVSGTGIFVKQGVGTLILNSPSSTLTGPVMISEGTLQVDGVIPTSAGAVTVVAGATLAGSGTVQRSVTVNGGTLSPGSSVGALQGLVTLTLGASSSFDFEVSDWTGAVGTGYDTVTADAVTVTATDVSPVTVSITPQTLANFSDTQKTFTLVATTGGISGFTPGAFVVDASALPAATAFVWSVQVQGNNLVLVYGEASGTPFESWVASKGLTGPAADFDADPDFDGITNGIEFVIGGQPNPANPNADSAALLPTATTDATHLRFVFRRSDLSDPAKSAVHYDTDLAGAWTPAQHGSNGVVVTPTNDIEPGIDSVEVAIPRALAPGGKLFARLVVTE